MKLIDDPDARFWFLWPRAAGAGRTWPTQRRHQVTGIGPAPPPVVTEYVAQAEQCPCCAAVTEVRAHSGPPRRETPAHSHRQITGPSNSPSALNSGG